jgi:hypothetical protein
MPTVWRSLWASTQGRIDHAGSLVMSVAGVVAVGLLIARRRRLAAWAATAVLAGAYAWLLLNLGRSPAERLHLAEYGLLSVLVLRALRIDWHGGGVYYLAWLIAGLLGAFDEVIQWALPNRVFEWKDVGLNIASSGLGMALAVVLMGRDPGGSEGADR